MKAGMAFLCVSPEPVPELRPQKGTRPGKRLWMEGSSSRQHSLTVQPWHPPAWPVLRSPSSLVPRGGLRASFIPVARRDPAQGWAFRRAQGPETGFLRPLSAPA